MKRVEIANPFVGICHMQVCAVPDASDDEILALCNCENSSGTTNGWSTVIRENHPPSELWPIDRIKPINCPQYKGRKHFVVWC